MTNDTDIYLLNILGFLLISLHTINEYFRNLQKYSKCGPIDEGCTSHGLRKSSMRKFGLVGEEDFGPVPLVVEVGQNQNLLQTVQDGLEDNSGYNQCNCVLGIVTVTMYNNCVMLIYRYLTVFSVR